MMVGIAQKLSYVTVRVLEQKLNQYKDILFAHLIIIYSFEKKNACTANICYLI